MMLGVGVFKRVFGMCFLSATWRESLDFGLKRSSPVLPTNRPRTRNVHLTNRGDRPLVSYFLKPTNFKLVRETYPTNADRSNPAQAFKLLRVAKRLPSGRGFKVDHGNTARSHMGTLTNCITESIDKSFTCCFPCCGRQNSKQSQVVSTLP